MRSFPCQRLFRIAPIPPEDSPQVISRYGCAVWDHVCWRHLNTSNGHNLRHIILVWQPEATTRKPGLGTLDVGRMAAAAEKCAQENCDHGNRQKANDATNFFCINKSQNSKMAILHSGIVAPFFDHTRSYWEVTIAFWFRMKHVLFTTRCNFPV